MNPPDISHQNDDKEIARKRANQKVNRKLLEFIVIFAFAFFVLHECGHILTAYLIGFDMTGWYFYLNFPYLSWNIPAAPSASVAPFEWFIVRLSGSMMEGVLYLAVSLRKSQRHFLFPAFFAFVYSLFEAMGLTVGIVKPLLLLFGTAMILCAIFWMVRTIDRNELAFGESEE
ncbi:MAG: hypothetical protein RTV31_16355 [Candidatus Thorarchaeota archaeon]